jgi:type II secretory pathway pseudopilin PulG
MSRIHREESGFTLIELLLVCTLMLVVLGATLTTFQSFQSNAETNQRMNDAQDEARRGLETLARELRNLASPTNEEPQAVKRALGGDLIVQSVASTQPAGSLNSRNTQYVRYCLDTTTKRVWRQRKTWTTATDPAFPSGGNCPASGWDTTEFAAGYVENGSRSLFTYNSTVLTNITEIHTTLWVDVNPGKSPAETPISTTVFLRNQNRVPVASFSAAPVGGRILLNGSDSQDPEERALRYFWFDRAVTTSACSDPAPGCVGEGIVYEYTPPAPGNRTVYLIVKDPADLQSQAPNQTVCVTGTGETC